jgi:hypothetical protein
MIKSAGSIKSTNPKQTTKKLSKNKDTKLNKINNQELIDDHLFIPTISPQRITKSIENLEQMILEFELALGLSNGISSKQLDKLSKKFQNVIKRYS